MTQQEQELPFPLVELTDNQDERVVIDATQIDGVKHKIPEVSGAKTGVIVNGHFLEVQESTEEILAIMARARVNAT